MTTTVLAVSALRQAHVGWAWVVVVSNAVAGAWALAAHYRRRLRRRELWFLTAFAEIAVFVQVVLGVALRQSEHQGRGLEHLQFHMFYGFVAAFTVAIIYSYRAQLKEHLYMLYGLGGLFLMGLALRAIYINPI